MLFTHVERNLRLSISGQNQAFLVDDGWDDFNFKTLFELVVFDSKGNRTDPGGVKILSRSLPTGRVAIPQTFENLGPEYCSLGQDENYYEIIASLPGSMGDEILRALRDCVRDPEILSEFRNEEGFQTSLLRYVSEASVRTFAGILKGQAKLTPFSFAYTFPSTPTGETPPRMTFDVTPGSMPPTNVHVVIGRNGVGKTYLLGKIATVLCQPRNPTSPRDSGRLEFLPGKTEEALVERVTNLVTVTFSAFDPFVAPDVRGETGTTTRYADVRYTYVGLKKSLQPPDKGSPESTGPRDVGTKGLDELSEEFRQSFANCLSGPRRHRWVSAMQMLGTDPGFHELEILPLVEQEGEDGATGVSRVFSSLSAGHKIVLLIVTRLVELAEERTLVLLDEPEAHLHPPLLSSFIRALSHLLTLRNSVGIVSTHSPVVLQEVPKNCVWVLRRSGETVIVERPEIETFGENVGVLTREVFGLEVTKSGFHGLISERAAETPNSYDAVVRAFGNQLGAEARSIARVLTRREE